MHTTSDFPSRPSSSTSNPRQSRKRKTSNSSEDTAQPPLYSFPAGEAAQPSSDPRDRPPPYAPSTLTMAEGENLLGLVGTGITRHGQTTRRPRAKTASAADKRTRTSSDASSGNGDRDVTWGAPPSLGRMSSEYAQTRNNLLSADERTPLLGHHDAVRSPTTRSHRSISVTNNHNPYDPEALVTPRRPRPSSWKNMLRAPSQMNTPTLRVIDTPDGEAIVITRPKKKRHPVVRYLSPLWSATHWMALVHLIFINLPLVSLAASSSRDDDSQNPIAYDRCLCSGRS